jgi:hypothetical protein
MKKNERHSLSYFNLLDAFSADKCPICSLIDRESKRHLRALYYEFVNDAGVRNAMHRSRGLCNWHAWTSTEIPCSNTGISIIYRDLLNNELATLREILDLLETPQSFLCSLTSYKRKKDLSLLISDWKKKEACIVCKANAGATLFHLRELLDHLHEKDFATKYRASQGLCLPHLKILVEKFPGHPNLPVALRIQIEKYQYLSWELGEFWRKHDYRFENEPKGSETDSWLRAIRQFVGMREHFGNDLRLTYPSPARASLSSRLKRTLQKIMHTTHLSERTRETNKQNTAFLMTGDLRRAIDGPGCPVCRIGNEALKTYFSRLMKKNYDNPSHLAQIKNAGGFCRTHAAWLLHHGTTYKATVLAEALVTAALGTLSAAAETIEKSHEKSTSHHRIRIAQRLLTHKGTCPACKAKDEAEKAALKQFALLTAKMDSRNFWEIYQASDGLCQHHLARALQYLSPETVLSLIRESEKKLTTASTNLKTTLKHFDIRHITERREKETDIWRGAMTLLCGVPKDEE